MQKTKWLWGIVFIILALSSTKSFSLEYGLRPGILGQYNYKSGGAFSIIANLKNNTDKAVWVSSLQADIGIDGLGIDTSVMNIVKVTDLVGGSWGGPGTPLKSSGGNIYYTKSVLPASKPGGSQGISINPGQEINLYQIDLSLPDALPASTQVINFRGIGLDKNQVHVNWSSQNALEKENPITINIMAPTPPAIPEGYTGFLSTSRSTDKGKEITLFVDTLPDSSDLAPPLHYDIYREELPGFNPAESSPVITAVSPGSVAARSSFQVTDAVPEDCKTYYYKIAVRDNTSFSGNSGHKAIVNSTNPLAVKSHDYTPPQAPQITPQLIGDRQITVNWINPSDPDTEGIIILRKAGSKPAITPSELGNASGDSNGTPPPEVGKIFADSSVVIHRTSISPDKLGQPDSYLDSGGLENGGNYYYAVVAYDSASDSPRKQGYNYSYALTDIPQIPGAPPLDVSNLRALSDPNNGEITLLWTNPDPKSYGGAVIAYSTKYDDWNFLAPEKSMYSSDVPIPGAAANDTSLTKPATSITLGGLSTTETYYFKVFAHNIVADKSNRLYSPGVMTAAIPLKGGGGTTIYVTKEVNVNTPPSISVNLKKKEGGFGINAIIFPFEPIYDENDKQLATLADLVDKINAAAKEKVVATIGYWDKETQQIIGFVFDDNGKVKAKKGTTSEIKDLPLKEFIGYQVYVTRTVPAMTFKTKYKTE